MPPKLAKLRAHETLDPLHAPYCLFCFVRSGQLRQSVHEETEPPWAAFIPGGFHDGGPFACVQCVGNSGTWYYRELLPSEMPSLNGPPIVAQAVCRVHGEYPIYLPHSYVFVRPIPEYSSAQPVYAAPASDISYSYSRRGGAAFWDRGAGVTVEVIDPYTAQPFLLVEAKEAVSTAQKFVDKGEALP